MPDLKDEKAEATVEEKQEAELVQRLHKLDVALKQKQDDSASSPVTRGKAPKNNELVKAWRVGTDFVAAVLVGAALGWGIDKLVGSTPWGMIIFLLLGFAAGILNVMRTLGTVTQPSIMRTKEDNNRKGSEPDQIN